MSLAPKILVDDARIEWTDPAIGVDRQVRACTPGPGAWTTWEGERFKVGRGHRRHRPRRGSSPASSRSPRTPCYVGTATDPVELGEVKAFGKKQMRAADWARGVVVPEGARLG